MAIDEPSGQPPQGTDDSRGDRDPRGLEGLDDTFIEFLTLPAYELITEATVRARTRREDEPKAVA